MRFPTELAAKAIRHCPSQSKAGSWPGSCRNPTNAGSGLPLSERCTMRSIRIDRTKPLAGEPHLGHNRYHPDIAPVAEVGEGEEIALETRDALDGQIKPGMAGADLVSIEAGVVHPLTGPVFVKGARPGDAL